jgi:hypothetical protein
MLYCATFEVTFTKMITSVNSDRDSINAKPSVSSSRPGAWIARQRLRGRRGGAPLAQAAEAGRQSHADTGSDRGEANGHAIATSVLCERGSGQKEHAQRCEEDLQFPHCVSP